MTAIALTDGHRSRASPSFPPGGARAARDGTARERGAGDHQKAPPPYRGQGFAITSQEQVKPTEPSASATHIFIPARRNDSVQ